MTIFISHATEDDSFVNQLRNELHARGFRTWVDHFDIPAGENWIDVIEEALAQSLLLLLIVSPNSLSSHFVRKEWGVFLAENRRIIPLKVEECDAPMMLRDLQHIAFTDKTIDPAAITQLVEVLPKKQTGTLTMPKGMNHITDLMESPVIPPEAGAGLSQKIQFIFPDFEQRLNFEISQPMIIGRSDPDSGMVDVDLTPFDAGKRGVSRRHALLRYTPQGVIITDLSSKNGTQVDGHKVSPGENFVVSSGAHIRLGILEFQIVNVDDK
jgi:hypothetical protein